MRVLSARLGNKQDEETGIRPGFVTLELEEWEVRSMIGRRAAILERGVSVRTARDTIAEIDELKVGLDSIHIHRSKS